MRSDRIIVLLTALGACTPVEAPRGPVAADPAGSAAVTGGARGAALLVPPGHGTLRQDEITVALRSGALQIKVTPLAESVIRLTAPDTYQRLHALAESRRAEVGRGTLDGPELFLVSFFSAEPNATFQPEDVHVVQQGRLLRPQAILPVTSGWGRLRLEQQQSATAIYAFDAWIDLDLPLVVRYGLEESDAWSRILPQLEIERTRVRARAAAGVP